MGSRGSVARRREGLGTQEFIAVVYEQLAGYLGLEVFFHYQLQPESGRLRLAAWSGVSGDVAAEALLPARA